MINYQIDPEANRERKGLKERRARILEAAETVFAEKGFEAATVDEIAARAEVGKGTVYRRCGDKQQLLHILLHKAAHSLGETIVAETQKEPDPVKKLLKIFSALCDWHENNLALGKLLFASVHPTGKEKKHGHDDEQRRDHLIFKVTRDVLKEGIKKGLFSRTTDPLIITEGIFHFLTPAFYEELRQRYGLSSEQIARMAFNLFYKGLKR